MKKTLFGYDIKETDNLFNSMQNHIDVLTGKITNLNAELAAKGNNVADTQEIDRKVVQLQSKITDLEKENQALKRELSSHPKTEVQDSTKKVEYVGKIYLTAYEDAEKIKKNALKEAEAYLTQFDDIKSEAKNKLSATLADIKNQQSNLENILNESVQRIVEMLRDFGIESDVMQNKIEVLDKNLEEIINVGKDSEHQLNTNIKPN